MSTIPPATTLFRPGLRLLQTKGRGRCGRTDRARSNRTVSAPLVVCLSRKQSKDASIEL
jgi:hypothetical protein